MSLCFCCSSCNLNADLARYPSACKLCKAVTHTAKPGVYSWKPFVEFLFTFAFLKNLSFSTRFPALPICEGLTAMQPEACKDLCRDGLQDKHKSIDSGTGPSSPHSTPRCAMRALYDHTADTGRARLWTFPNELHWQKSQSTHHDTRTDRLREGGGGGGEFYTDVPGALAQVIW